MTIYELTYLTNKIMKILNDCADSKAFCNFVEMPEENAWGKAQNDLIDMYQDDDLHFYGGATKGVIMNDELNYVIKLPFLYEKHFEDWNSKTQEYRKVWYEPDADYCRIEWRNYAKAVEAGIGECFAPTYYVGKFRGCPVYVQEKCYCDEKLVSDASYDSAWREWQEHNSGCYHDNEEMEEDFSNDFYAYESEDQISSLTYECWDAKVASKFWNFCEDMMIGDLHSGNWSYDDNDQSLRVVDYSGFGFESRDAFEEDEYCRNMLVA